MDIALKRTGLLVGPTLICCNRTRTMEAAEKVNVFFFEDVSPGGNTTLRSNLTLFYLNKYLEASKGVSLLLNWSHECVRVKENCLLLYMINTPFPFHFDWLLHILCNCTDFFIFSFPIHVHVFINVFEDKGYFFPIHKGYFFTISPSPPPLLKRSISVKM